MNQTLRMRPIEWALFVLVLGCSATAHGSGVRNENPAENSSTTSQNALAKSESVAPARSSSVSIPARSPWLGADKKPLPFQRDEEILEFLRTAEVVSSKRVGEGINGIHKVLLERDGVQAHAAFRDVRVQKQKYRVSSGRVYMNFRDDCRYELVAYRLSRLLGLDNVPPVVKRTIDRKKGTLQIWLEDAMMEKKRSKEEIQPPNRLQWLYQRQNIYVFDNLIYNEDRNQGNILYDSNWKVWMIDHTRAFRLHKRLRNAQMIRYCSRSLWKAIKQLDRDVLKQNLEGILTHSEMKGLLVRRDRLVAHIQNVIDKKGEGSVLF